MPVGGGPPASRPRRELRSARRLEARPGPATAHGHRSQAHQSLRRPPHQRRLLCSRVVLAPPPPTGTAARPPHLRALARQALTPLTPAPTPNFARNSPSTVSNFEFRSLELQRFQTSLKLHPIELRATFLEGRPRHCPRAPQPGPSPATRPYEREKIRPARLHQRPRAKKFAQRTQNTPKSAFFRLLGEFFRGLDQNPLLLGEPFRADGATATSQHPPTTLPETDDTKAGGSLPRDETADTFARTRRRISGRFSPAKASRVSFTPRRAPAKAMEVSPSPDATPTAQTLHGVHTRHNAGGTLAT